MSSQLSSLVRTLLELLFKGLAVLLAFATPLLGVWCASSLAAYSNGPIWLALLTGALLFPVLPVAWELWAERRARRKGLDSKRKRFLTAGDRLVLRTLALNGGFLLVLLAAFPRVAFAALSTRGDWMVEGNSSARAAAWNAARIQGHWYLLDATWDSGSVNEATFTKRYTTDYLLTPPEVFGADHFPDDPNWQLLEAPLSRGDFLRQPAMRPSFFAKGLRLIQPTRSQVTVNGSLDVTLANPRGVWLSGVFGKTSRERCRFVRGEVSHLECAFPFDGKYALKLFTNDAEFGTYRYAGMLQVNSTP